MDNQEAPPEEVCPSCGKPLALVGPPPYHCPKCHMELYCKQHHGPNIEARVDGETGAEVARVAGEILKHTPVANTNITVSDSVVGVLNAGERSDMSSLSVNISDLVESGQQDVATALTALAEAIRTSAELEAAERSHVLDLLAELAQQAGLPKEKRAKAAAIKAVLSGLATSIGAAGGLAEVWSTWGPAVQRFFGF
jgi:hypothetical protein